MFYNRFFVLVVFTKWFSTIAKNQPKAHASTIFLSRSAGLPACFQPRTPMA